MPQEPLHACMARRVSMPSISFFFVKSQTVSRIRMRGSPMDVTRSRVSSSDFPTLTTTSSQTARTDLMAGMMGKSSFTALRTIVNPESIRGRGSGSELQVMKTTIESVSRVQLGVGASLHDAPFLQDHDLVGMLNRRQ